VVFVHALLLDSRLWLDQLDGVCDTRRCLRNRIYPAPCYCVTVDANAEIDMQRYADELVAFLEKM
jgi:hypothetical protein